MDSNTIILQVEHTECGVVALAMVFGYLENGYRWNIFEKFVAFQETVCINLLKYAREQGFDCNAYSLELDELREQKFPVIILEFNHFVVLEKFVGRDIG